MKNLILTAMLIGASATGAALAQARPDDVILGRQAGFDLLVGVVIDMKHALDTGADVKPYADNAGAMARWGSAIPGLFPIGTESGQDTAALPSIWSDRAGFEKAAADFAQAAGKLADAAKSGDKAAFADAFKATGGACGACHKAYRVKKS